MSLNGAYTSTSSSGTNTVLDPARSISSATVHGLSNTSSVVRGRSGAGTGIPIGDAITTINGSYVGHAGLTATGSGSTNLTFGTNESTLGTLGYNTYSGVTTIAAGHFVGQQHPELRRRPARSAPAWR